MQRASADTMTRARVAAYNSSVLATSSATTCSSSSVSQNMNDASGGGRGRRGGSGASCHAVGEVKTLFERTHFGGCQPSTMIGTPR